MNTTKTVLAAILFSFVLSLGVATAQSANPSPTAKTPQRFTIFTHDEALSKLLKNTGLTYERMSPNTVAITNPKTQAAKLSRTALRLAQNENSQSAAQTDSTSAPAEEKPQPGSPDTDSKNEELREVVVTGSRIKRPAEAAISPVVSVGEAEIENRGVTNVIDLLREIPAVQGSETPFNTSFTFADIGVSRASLRGLEAFRTLTVVNNRRRVGVPDSFFARDGFDLNVIPTSLIQRVDVLTGGASAVYGSDAVAGVINVILKNNFSGFEFGGTGFAPETNGYRSGSVYSTAGRNFSRGNFIAHLEYTENSHLTAADSARLGFAGFVGNRRRDGSVLFPGQPPEVAVRELFSVFDARGDSRLIPFFFNPVQTGNFDGFAPIDQSGNFLRNGSGDLDWGTTTSLNPLLYDRSLGKFRAIDLGRNGLLDSFACDLQSGCELAPSNNVIYPKSNRINAYTRGRFELTPNIALVGEGIFSRTKGTDEIGPVFFSRNFNNPFISTQLDVVDANGQVVGAAHNPFVTQTLQDQLDTLGAGGGFFTETRAFPEFGDRKTDRTQNYYSLSAGLEGKLPDLGWNWEVYYESGRSKFEFTSINDQQDQRFFDATDLIFQANGQLACRSAQARAEGCVPADILGSLSQQAIDYLTFDHTSSQISKEQLAQASLSGGLGKFFRLPAGEVLFNLGLEHRKDRGERRPSLAFEQGLGFGRLTLPGFSVDNSVTEGFVETIIPIVADLPFVKRLEIEGGLRLTDYKVGADEIFKTWKAGGTWQITSDLRIRGVKARSIRAPAPTELNLPQSIGFIGYTDPCDRSQLFLGDPATGAAFSQTRLQNCSTLLGLSEAQLRNFRAFPSGLDSSGGNPGLRPEISDTTTIGIVATPRWTPGLSIIADYFRFNVSDLVSQLGEQTIIDDCVDSPTIDNQFCGLVQRTGQGQISLVLDTFVNVDRQFIDGIDFESNYNFSVDSLLHLFGASSDGDRGRINFRANAQYLRNNDFVSHDFINNREIVNDNTDESFAPKYQGSFSASYTRGPWNAYWSMFWVANTIDPETADIPGELDTLCANRGHLCKFPANAYHDVSVGYRMPWNNLRITAGINDVTNAGPRRHPFLYRGSDGLDRILGRSYFLSASLNFSQGE